ncbi:hypothetical protein DU000_00790 [Parvibium lacunae]|uniref:Uncharacterized protein n=1 Tax=Parvibium lacunae TaxID=1888893 RepID=A0A368L6X5_9BURK|nr:hypothetical protein DU000_00790 [Parvibium lacunae]
MKQPLAQSKAWTLLICSILLPWLITIGSINAIELWLPGQIRVDYWRNLSSTSFILGTGLGVYALLNINLNYAARIITATVLIIIGFWLAFMLQISSNCGDEQIYVGESGKTIASSCEQ